MRYYKHNLGDFLADTHYLTNERLAVYLKLIWEYYLQEKPITIDDYYEKADELRTDEPTLSYILHKYFYLDEDIDNEVWRHKRIDGELQMLQNINSKKAQGAQSRWDEKTLKLDGFDEFWRAYPNKKDKQKAMRAWSKHRPELKKVLSALKTQSQSDQWTKEDGRFIPLPTTWLNGARWEDEASGKPEKVDRLVIANELYKKDKDFYNLTKEEQNERINNYTK